MQAKAVLGMGRAAGLPGFGATGKKFRGLDDMSLEEYFAFTIGWLAEVKRVLKAYRFNVDTRYISQCGHHQFCHATS